MAWYSTKVHFVNPRQWEGSFPRTACNRWLKEQNYSTSNPKKVDCKRCLHNMRKWKMIDK